MRNLDLIVVMKFGSHLYGTATPDSDTDYKGIFMPTRDEILLSRVSKSHNESTKDGSVLKNAPGDIDTEIYSLHYFIKLACEGQTAALDMLHAPANMLILTSPIWETLVRQRDKFYTRNLKSFVSYARKQAAKYGIKGSRLNAAQVVIDFLDEQEEHLRLIDVWSKLPRGEHIHDDTETPDGIRIYQVCGKKFPATAKVEYTANILERFVEVYGLRARQAARNEGIDWKAMSHALRAAFQVREILKRKTITYPLPQADYLRSVKAGEFDYTTQVAPDLESLMDEVEDLSAKSDLPDKVDFKYWDNWLAGTVARYHFNY